MQCIYKYLFMGFWCWTVSCGSVSGASSPVWSCCVFVVFWLSNSLSEPSAGWLGEPALLAFRWLGLKGLDLRQVLPYKHRFLQQVNWLGLIKMYILWCCSRPGNSQFVFVPKKIEGSRRMQQFTSDWHPLFSCSYMSCCVGACQR